MDSFATRRRRDIFVSLVALAGFLSAAVFPVRAQVPAGEIRLEVKDPSGAITPASGRLRNLAAGTEQFFQTDAQGKYTLMNLTPGSYRLEVSRSGFATQIAQIDVQPGTPVSRTITLELRSEGSSIDVISVTPVPGTDISRDQIPAPVQAATAKDIEASGATDLSEFLNKRFNGVYVNENQANPFQPDVNYRGYEASPLLGTPEGISVYMDGVRQNQPFGDIVAWDLIPKIAVEEMELTPGSNPLYGMNTLGAAIAIQTKDGVSHPGTSISANGGMFGRRAVEAEHGGSNSKGLNWYFAGNLYKEDGWRQFSPSTVRQSFGKLGWQRGKTTLGLSFSYGDNNLTGNGVQDFRLLPKNYSSVYTIPDITRNHSPSVTLSARHDATANLSFSGVAYFRYVRSDAINGNLNSNSFDESVYNLSAADTAALTAAGYTGFPTTGNATTEPFPYWRCIAQGLEKNEPVEKCDGQNITSWTKQNNFGFSGAMTWRNPHNHLTVGFALDHSSLTFQQQVQFAYLNPDAISLTLVPFFADGTSNSNGVPVDGRVYLHGITNTPAFYASDTYTRGKLSLTLSGRYNYESVNNLDRLPPGFPGEAGSDGGRASLTSYSTYSKFNPAAGLTYAASRYFSGYFSFTQSSRAPSAIELGCSDQNDPCNLPNALVADPPLKQVTTRTFEAGIRSAPEQNLRWSIGLFHGINYDDLLFVSSNTTGFGYFTNFGKTRRQGGEASISGRIGHFVVGANYTFIDATYQSPQTIDGGANSSNDSAVAGNPGVDDNIEISAGNRIPQIPRNVGKAYVDYSPIKKLTVDVDFRAIGRSYARGNENNLDKPDGVYYLGQGYSPGYGVTNAGARYQLHRRVQLFVQINNVFDHHYYTAAILAATPFNNSGQMIFRPFPAYATGPQAGNYPIRSTTFFAPGAPIDVFGGLKFTF
jgi:outer membrane receptor protein involved in Fe transport